MRKTRLKILYGDVNKLSFPEREYQRNAKTGQITLSRKCKRFYRKLAKRMWRNGRTVMRLEPVHKHDEHSV